MIFHVPMAPSKIEVCLCLCARLLPHDNHCFPSLVPSISSLTRARRVPSTPTSLQLPPHLPNTNPNPQLNAHSIPPVPSPATVSYHYVRLRPIKLSSSPAATEGTQRGVGFRNHSLTRRLHLYLWLRFPPLRYVQIQSPTPSPSPF